MGALVVLYAGLVNWLVATIVVESSLFTAARNWLTDRTWYVTCRDERHRCGGKRAFIWPEDATEAEANAEPYNWGPWLKPAQLVTCQLCIRVWIGFAEAAYFGGPDHGLFRLVANGLLYAAAGHFILELRSKLAKVV